jgi:23S rRNA pseudouridine955/2504/2580 synthase
LSKVSVVTVSADRAGQRIDNFLLARLKGVPRTAIYKILRRGEVRVNGGRIKPSYRLEEGDQVRIPPVRTSDAKNIPAVSQNVSELLEAAVLYEDKDFMVINKPAGMAVHGGSGISLGVVEAVRQIRPHAKRIELVHRLDRDTSGCLVIAKKTGVLTALQRQFVDGEVMKSYTAVLVGTGLQTQFEVNQPLRKNTLKSGERMVIVAADGKSARTGFTLRQELGGLSWVDIQLYTGRTHQIRVHSAHVKHPVLGDRKYGDEAANKLYARQGYKRLFLHAQNLQFTHPNTETHMNISAPLDQQFSALIAQS